MSEFGNLNVDEREAAKRITEAVVFALRVLPPERVLGMVVGAAFSAAEHIDSMRPHFEIARAAVSLFKAGKRFANVTIERPGVVTP